MLTLRLYAIYPFSVLGICKSSFALKKSKLFIHKGDNSTIGASNHQKK